MGRRRVASAHDLRSDRGVTMVRKGSKVNSCLATMSMEEAILLRARGGLVRPYFQERDCRPHPAPVVTRILCHWCREYHSPGEVEACMAIPKPVATESNGSLSSATAKMPQWLSGCAQLWEFLTKPSYADGTQRQLGKVSLCFVSGGLQVTLTDPTSSTYSSRVYRDLETALLEIEEALESGMITWRPSGPPRGRKRP